MWSYLNFFLFVFYGYILFKQNYVFIFDLFPFFVFYSSYIEKLWYVSCTLTIQTSSNYFWMQNKNYASAESIYQGFPA